MAYKLKADITIIGGGAGGYMAAVQAAKMGAKVVVVEKDKLGGTCFNRGGVPAKTLVHSAQTYQYIKRMDKIGIYADNLAVDFKKVMQRTNDVAEETVAQIYDLMIQHHIMVIEGKGIIQDRQTVIVEDEGGNQKTTIQTTHIIIATGSQPMALPIEGLDSEAVVNSEEFFSIRQKPEHMIVLGGGFGGMEYAFALAEFGVRISVLEAGNRIMNPIDEDMLNLVKEMGQEKGIQIYENAKTTRVRNDDFGHVVVEFEQNGKNSVLTGEKLLVAIGREAVTDDIGLENIGIETVRKKAIPVNKKMQTEIEGIYAIGDAAVGIWTGTVAMRQGVVAVRNIMEQPCEMDESVLPGATYAGLEICFVGIMEDQARQKGLDITVGKFPFAHNAKAVVLDERRGFVKIVKDNGTGKIIGASVMGPRAAALIGELMLAVKNEITCQQLIDTIHVHPTTTEAIQEAVNIFEKE